MAAKANTPKKTATKKSSAAVKPETQSGQEFDNELPEDDEAPVRKTSSKKISDEDDDEDDAEVSDDWETAAQEDTWEDPDFAEFDMPKSKKKSGGSSSKNVDADDDFREFDHFTGSGRGGSDDDDDF